MQKFASKLVYRLRTTVHKLKKTVNCKSFGFTIIELLVVISLIGILVTVTSIAYGNVREKARDSERKEELKAVKTALLMYYQDYDEYPACTGCTSDSDNWIDALVQKGYIKSLPKDPKQAGLISTLASLIKEKIKFNSPSALPQPQVAAVSNVEISASYDAYVYRTSARYGYVDTSTTARVGRTTANNYSDRTLITFPLSSIPAGATIKSVGLKINVVGGGTYRTSVLADVQAYNQTGQEDPSVYNNATRFASATNDPTLYIDNSTGLQNLGIYTFNFSAEANSDLATAKTAVDRFSLAINENGTANTDGYYSNIESTEDAGTNEPKLLVTYSAGGASPIPTPSPTPTPIPTPSPTPSPSPTPTPPSSPSPTPAPSSNIYNYQVAPDQKSFVLWAILEKTNDPEAWGNSGATCAATKPDPKYNFCIESPN